MNERAIVLILITGVLFPGTASADEPPLLSQDEIALLVESENTYSHDEVTELLTMVITIADEELEREERARIAGETRLAEQEILIERLRYRSRLSSIFWVVVGTAFGTTMTTLLF